jgi:excisionase family DNA binding protein
VSVVALTLSEEAIERIAMRAAEIVLAELDANATSEEPYFTVAEAATYLRAKPQRVYDLLSAGRLTRHKDGRRVLIARTDLDAHLG